MNTTTETHERPIYAKQLWCARNLLAERGLDALHNPHAATGKICGCGACFCCAALEVYNEARHGQAKIYWRDLQPQIPVRLANHQYITSGNSLVYWNGHESGLAVATMEDRIAEQERSLAR